MANVKTTLVQFQNTAFPGNASVWRWPLATSFGGFAVSATQFNTMRPAGTYSNLRARVVTNTNNNTSTLRFNNNGSNSNLVIAIGTTQTGSFEDIVDTDNVINGGAGYMHLTVVNGSTGSITFVLTQIDFLAASDTHTTIAAHGSASLSTTSTTCYNGISATIASTVTTESQTQTQFKHSCKLKNFRVFVSVDSRTGNTVHRIRKNGADGNQSITTSATGVFEDVTNTDTVVYGDKICFSTTTDATAGGTHTWTNVGFDVENINPYAVFPFPATGASAQNFGVTRYECPSLVIGSNTVEANAQVKLYQPRTLKNLGVNLFTNTINGTTTVRMRKNGADANPVVSIGSSTTGFFSDDSSTTNTAANDLINFSVVTGGSSGSLTYGSLYVDVSEVIKVGYKTGSFPAIGTTGLQDVTDVGFLPKALILWMSGTTNEAYRDSAFNSYGFTDGTTDCCVGSVINDPVATSVTKSNIYNDSLVMLTNNGTSYYGRANFDSWLASGFRINWVENAGVTNQVINYIAIGGDDITNVKVGTQSLGLTTTGNKSYTGVGFQGDILITAHNGSLPSASAYTYNTTIESHAGIQIGVAKSPTEEFTTTAVSRDVQAIMDSYRYQRGDKCFSYLDNSTGTLLAESDFVSWGSDGWTWNVTTNTTANNQNAPFIYLAIKGGLWDVGYLTSPATNTTVQTNTRSLSPDCKLRGIFTTDVASNLITTPSIASHFIFDIGASDGTNTTSISTFDLDAADPSVAVGICSNTYLVWQFLPNATATSSTLIGRCTVSFAQNSFTTTWTNTDGNSRYIPYFAVSERLPTVTKVLNLIYDIDAAVKSFFTKQVSVLSNAGTGTQNITFTPSGTDPSWTPKAAIVTWSRANTTPDVFAEHMSNGFGFTDGTNSRCVATASEDNQARGDSARLQRNNALIVPLTQTGTIETVDAVATFVSWLTNGMQITWSDAPAAQFYINVLFLGGDDITNVDVGTLATGTGTSPISVTSLAYQPDCGIFLSGGTATENTPVVTGFMSVGAATSNTAQWVQGIYSQDNPVTMITKQYFSHGKVIVSFTNTAVDGYATFTSFNSNGFTLTPTDAFPASFPIYYFVIKGGSFAVGNATEPASISTQTINTTKKTNAVMIFGLDAGTADAVQGLCTQTIGMCDDGLVQGVEVFDDVDAVADSIVVSRHDTNQIYLNISGNATATSSTLDDEANISAVSATGFTMNWTNIGQAMPYRYITFGAGIPKTAVTKVLNLLYDLIGQATKQLTTRFDVIAQTTKTGTIRFDVLKEIATPKQVTIRFDVRKEIPTKQLTLRYDVIGQVIKILTSRFDVRQEVTDTNTLKFDVRAEVTDTNTLRFDIRKEITPKQVTLRYDIITQIIKILTTRYDVRREISPPKQVTLKHDIRAEIAKSNTIRYDIRQEITKLLTAKFDIISQVSKQLTILFDVDVAGLTTVLKTLNLIYNIRSEIATPKQVTLRYDVRKEVEKTNTFKFDVRMPITKQVTIIHNLLKEVSKSTTIKYDVIAQVTKAVSLLFKITTSLEKISQLKFSVDAQVTKTNTLIYNVNNTITKTNTIIYNILKDVTKQTTLKYDVIGQTTKILNLLYNIDSSLTNVIKTLTLKHNIDAQMTKASTFKYNVNVPITKANSIRYDIRNEITKISTIRFSIISQITKTLTTLYTIMDEVEKSNMLKFRIDQQVTKTVSLKYNVLNEITKQTSLRFNILKDIVKTTTFLFNVISQTTKSVSIKYNVNNIIQKTNTLLYTINSLVESDVTLRYDVRKEIEKDVDLKYDIISQITKTTNIQYNILNEITKTQTLIYDILKEVEDSVTIRYDMASQVQKLVTLKHNILKSLDKSTTLIFNILPESITEHATMHEQLLDYINLQYSISNPLKTNISWHEWYNGISDITIESSFISLVPIDRNSNIIYKEKSYQCAIHIWYRDYGDDPEGQNTPTELSNVIREISSIINRSRYNMYNEFNKNVYEMRIRDERFIPDEYSKGSDGKVLHYRYIVEMKYQQLIS